jgi:hypothetical protein
LFGLRVVAPQVPGALVVVIGGHVESALFNLGDNGVALAGDVPPNFHLDVNQAVEARLAELQPASG